MPNTTGTTQAICAACGARHTIDTPPEAFAADGTGRRVVTWKGGHPDPMNSATGLCGAVGEIEES